MRSIMPISTETRSRAGARQRHVVVFARAPELGAVKTRLASDIGHAHALQVYRILGARAIAAACAVPDARVEVHFTPSTGRALVVDWLRKIVAGPAELFTQVEGSLGDRMAAAIEGALARGAQAVAVIGTDCPALDAAVIDRALAAVEGADVALGPADDGGYYLVAVRAHHPALFTGIPWSSPDTLRCTLDAAQRAGLRVALLDTLMDVDTGEDLRRWREEASPAVPDGGSASM